MKKTSIICNIFLCAIFFGLPLIMDRGYFNISAAKSLYFLLLCSAFCIITVVRMILSAAKNKLVACRVMPLDIAIVSFVVINIVSAICSNLGADVWLGRDSRLQGALIIVLYGLMYMGISRNFISFGNKKYPIRYMATGFVFVVLLALLHCFNIDPTGTFANMQAKQRHLFITTIGNTNFFSAYACLSIPVFIILSAHANNRLSYICWGIVLALSGVTAVLTCSEGFVLGFAAFLIIAPFFFFENQEKFIRFCISVLAVLISAAAFYNIYAAIDEPIYHPSELVTFFLGGPWVWLTCLTVFAACLLAHYKPTSLHTVGWVYSGLIAAALVFFIVLCIYANKNGFEHISRFLVFDDSWGSGRGKVYRLCAEVLQDFSLKQWLIGIGPEALQNVMKQRGITYIDQAHSEYLQSLITTGISGLTCQLAIIILTVAAVLRRSKQDPVAVAFLMGLVAYWAQACVSIAQSFTTPIAYIYIGILGGIYKNTIAVNSPISNGTK